MIYYKTDVLKKLKDSGYSSYRIRNEKLLSTQTMTNIKQGKSITLDTLNKICLMCDVKPNDVIGFKKTQNEILKMKRYHLIDKRERDAHSELVEYSLDDLKNYFEPEKTEFPELWEAWTEVEDIDDLESYLAKEYDGIEVPYSFEEVLQNITNKEN